MYKLYECICESVIERMKETGFFQVVYEIEKCVKSGILITDIIANEYFVKYKDTIKYLLNSISIKDIMDHHYIIEHKEYEKIVITKDFKKRIKYIHRHSNKCKKFFKNEHFKWCCPKGHNYCEECAIKTGQSGAKPLNNYGIIPLNYKTFSESLLNLSIKFTLPYVNDLMDPIGISHELNGNGFAFSFHLFPGEYNNKAFWFRNGEMINFRPKDISWLWGRYFYKKNQHLSYKLKNRINSLKEKNIFNKRKSIKINIEWAKRLNKIAQASKNASSQKIC